MAGRQIWRDFMNKVKVFEIIKANHLATDRILRSFLQIWPLDQATIFNRTKYVLFLISFINNLII